MNHFALKPIVLINITNYAVLFQKGNTLPRQNLAKIPRCTETVVKGSRGFPKQPAFKGLPPLDAGGIP